MVTLLCPLHTTAPFFVTKDLLDWPIFPVKESVDSPRPSSPLRQSTKSIFIASLYSVALSFPDDNNFSCPGRLFLSKGKFSLHVCLSPKKLGIFKLLSNEKYWISWKVFSRMVGDIILNPITWCQFAFFFFFLKCLIQFRHGNTVPRAPMTINLAMSSE